MRFASIGTENGRSSRDCEVRCAIEMWQGLGEAKKLMESHNRLPEVSKETKKIGTRSAWRNLDPALKEVIIRDNKKTARKGRVGMNRR